MHVSRPGIARITLLGVDMPTPTTAQKRTSVPSRSESSLPPNTIDGETLPLRPKSSEHDFDATDAIARLLVGGGADLSDVFLRLLEAWESQVLDQHQATIVEEEEDLGDILRYLLIGIAFQSQRQVRSTAGTVGSWLLGAANTTAAVTGPIRRSWLLAPARRTAGAITNRLEDHIADLVSEGRAEEFVGRLMAETALQDSVSWVMDYIAENPEIRDLVQTQAIGFTEEIAIGVRERSITADNVLDGLLRKLFRRTPRSELPGPPQEVQEREEEFDRLRSIRA
jgi:hypothetical protein